LQVFNAKTKKWSKVAAMNCKRSAVGAVALGDHLYVCGGFDGISRLVFCARAEAVLSDQLL
jgi:Kelch motif